MSGTTRFCPNCGAANPMSARACLACGQALPSRRDVSSLWGDAGQADPPPAGAASDPSPPAGGKTARGRAKGDPSTQETAAVGEPAGRFEPSAYVVRQQAFDQAGSTGYPGYSEYASNSGYADSSAPQGAPPDDDRPARRGGRGGCLMGLVAFLVICLLTAVLAGLVVGQPLLEDAVGEELHEVLATQVGRELDASVNRAGLAAGTYLIRAEEINEDLAAEAHRYEPIEHPRVTIEEDGFAIRFEVYGLEGSYRGMVAAERGRIVLTDVEADGAAARVLPADEVREIVEEELNAYFAREELTVERVELGDGVLTVVTTPAAGTPAAAAPSRRTPTADAADPTATTRPRRTPTPADEDAAPTPTRRTAIPLRTPTPTEE